MSPFIVDQLIQLEFLIHFLCLHVTSTLRDKTTETATKWPLPFEYWIEPMTNFPQFILTLAFNLDIFLAEYKWVIVWTEFALESLVKQTLGMCVMSIKMTWEGPFKNVPRGKGPTRENEQNKKEKKMIEYKSDNKFSFSTVVVSFLCLGEVNHGTTLCLTLRSLNAYILSSILFVMFKIKNIVNISGFWRNWIGICYILSI